MHPAGEPLSVGLVPEESLAELFQSMVVSTHMGFPWRDLSIQESTKGSCREVVSICCQGCALVKLAVTSIGLPGLCRWYLPGSMPQAEEGKAHIRPGADRRGRHNTAGQEAAGQGVADCHSREMLRAGGGEPVRVEGLSDAGHHPRESVQKQGGEEQEPGPTTITERAGEAQGLVWGGKGKRQVLPGTSKV